MRQVSPLSLALLVLLAACASTAPQAPPGYQSAYAEGCRDGYKDGGLSNNYLPMRNDQLYATDKQYRQAWDAGYSSCFDRAISKPRRR